MSDPYRSHRASKDLLLPTEGATELKADRHPNVAERVIRSTMHVAAIVTLVLTSLLVLTIVQTLGSIGDGIDRLRAPEPSVTECVGEEPC